MASSNLLTGVPRTLLIPLRARAEEHVRADALFRDPQAWDWFQSLLWDAELETWYDWRYQVCISVRTKLLDNIAAQHIAIHPNSLVIELGAGLSSRYYRVGAGKTQWIELDLPEVIDIRLSIDSQTSEHRFLATSVLDQTWMNEIPAIEPENILFIAEGLFYYFEKSEVKQLVERLREKFADAKLALDVGGIVFKQLNAYKAANVGAPMKWFVEDERDVAALGLSVEKVFPLLNSYPERWGLVLWSNWWLIFWRSLLRNFCLILETKLNPVN
ncbi:class I SAM-dependent methyltransferase [Chlorogloeopsis sp. ULAP01]|uniref:class I SAM-dependent methyltransferase n=1 Tax=Chlorogloeopsis sp. ULAP01 TaxID=3056483 RepID=UPI0025AB30C7|nr:class I SAM-dependent methyltransferase [Chlorogloeopsis sp. ULAP01]MDM9380364.1 class I SAM-dependent methyltransferase [Chlorogloeopsis sp. ULAP01]